MISKNNSRQNSIGNISGASFKKVRNKERELVRESFAPDLDKLTNGDKDHSNEKLSPVDPNFFNARFNFDINTQRDGISSNNGTSRFQDTQKLIQNSLIDTAIRLERQDDSKNSSPIQDYKMEQNIQPFFSENGSSSINNITEQDEQNDETECYVNMESATKDQQQQDLSRHAQSFKQNKNKENQNPQLVAYSENQQHAETPQNLKKQLKEKSKSGNTFANSEMIMSEMQINQNCSQFVLQSKDGKFQSQKNKISNQGGKNENKKIKQYQKNQKQQFQQGSMCLDDITEAFLNNNCLPSTTANTYSNDGGLSTNTFNNSSIMNPYLNSNNTMNTSIALNFSTNNNNTIQSTKQKKKSFKNYILQYNTQSSNEFNNYRGITQKSTKLEQEDDGDDDDDDDDEEDERNDEEVNDFAKQQQKMLLKNQIGNHLNIENSDSRHNTSRLFLDEKINELQSLLDIERAKNQELQEKLEKSGIMQQEMRHYHQCLYNNLEEVQEELKQVKKEKNQILQNLENQKQQIVSNLTAQHQQKLDECKKLFGKQENEIKKLSTDLKKKEQEIQDKNKFYKQQVSLLEIQNEELQQQLMKTKNEFSKFHSFQNGNKNNNNIEKTSIGFLDLSMIHQNQSQIIQQQHNSSTIKLNDNDIQCNNTMVSNNNNNILKLNDSDSESEEQLHCDNFNFQSIQNQKHQQRSTTLGKIKYIQDSNRKARCLSHDKYIKENYTTSRIQYPQPISSRQQQQEIINANNILNKKKYETIDQVDQFQSQKYEHKRQKSQLQRQYQMQEMDNLHKRSASFCLEGGQNEIYRILIEKILERLKVTSSSQILPQIKKLQSQQEFIDCLISMVKKCAPPNYFSYYPNSETLQKNYDDKQSTQRNSLIDFNNTQNQSVLNSTSNNNHNQFQQIIQSARLNNNGNSININENVQNKDQHLAKNSKDQDTERNSKNELKLTWKFIKKVMEKYVQMRQQMVKSESAFEILKEIQQLLKINVVYELPNIIMQLIAKLDKYSKIEIMVKQILNLEWTLNPQELEKALNSLLNEDKEKQYKTKNHNLQKNSSASIQLNIKSPQNL